MSDPIKELGKAAEAYIAAGYDGFSSPSERAEAFQDLLNRLDALRDDQGLGYKLAQAWNGILAGEEPVIGANASEANASREDAISLLWKIRGELPEEALEATASRRSSVLTERRNLADSMAYAAADPEDTAEQRLRAAVPVPSRSYSQGEIPRLYDTGRFRLEARVSQVTVYDKAIGLEVTLVPDHYGLGVLSDNGELLHYAEGFVPSVLELSDGTRVFFPKEVTQRGWIIKDIFGVAFAGADPVVRVVTEDVAEIILRDVQTYHTWESLVGLGE